MQTIKKQFNETKLVTKQVNGVAQKVEVPTGYAGGEIELEVPDLENWSPEQLKDFALVFAKERIHYGPSTDYKAKMNLKKNPERNRKVLNSDSGPHTCEEGVYKVNPNWKVGAKSPAQEAAYQAKVAKAIAKAEAAAGRPLHENEVSLVTASV